MNAQIEQVHSRLALVIGNSNYDAGLLENPVHDAILIANTLDSLDFDVMLDTNLATKSDFQSVIREFGRLRPSYDVAFIYYAGHGIQIGNENFLLPTKEEFLSEFDVEDYGVSVQSILRYLNNTTDKANILILDACRNNPFESNWLTTRSLGGKGLAEIPPPNGSLIAFSTDAGQTAADGNDENSIYTSSLASNLLKPNVEINQVFKNVRTDVLLKTNNQQSPVENSKLTGGELYLNYQEDKLIVSLEEELEFTWNMYDSLKLRINSLSDRGVIRVDDDLGKHLAYQLFANFNSLSEKLKYIDQPLYQLAQLGMVKTGMIASSYSQEKEFSSNYHIEAAYEAAGELFDKSRQKDFELPRLSLARINSRNQFLNEIGVAYCIYAGQISNLDLVKKDFRLIDVLDYFDKSFEALDYTTQRLYIHIISLLITQDKVDVEKLAVLNKTNFSELLNSLSDNDELERLLLAKFCAYRYFEERSKIIRRNKQDAYDSEVGLFVCSELRTKLLWVWNFSYLMAQKPFQTMIEKYADNTDFKSEVLNAIHLLTEILELAWNENDEVERALSFKDTELKFLEDVLTNQIIVLDDFGALFFVNLGSERFRLTEFKITALETFKLFFQQPQVLDLYSVNEYDYLILQQKLNSYANSRVIRNTSPESYQSIQEKSDKYLYDVSKWFDDKFASTDRLDTLDERIIVSYSYFVQRFIFLETHSDQDSRLLFLKTARFLTGLGWEASGSPDFFSNGDVDDLWKKMRLQATSILTDSIDESLNNPLIIAESIELLQHYRNFYEKKFGGLHSGYTFQATLEILDLLEFCSIQENLGLLVNEWTRLAHSFSGLQQLRMRIGSSSNESEYTSYIEGDWDIILDKVESSSVLKQLSKEQTEMILSGFYNEVSQVQTFLSNDETQAFIQGRERLSSLIKTKF